MPKHVPILEFSHSLVSIAPRVTETGAVRPSGYRRIGRYARLSLTAARRRSYLPVVRRPFRMPIN